MDYSGAQNLTYKGWLYLYEIKKKHFIVNQRKEQSYICLDDVGKTRYNNVATSGTQPGINPIQINIMENL